MILYAYEKGGNKMSKYYKIGEVAQLYNVSIDTLRYYENLGLINPIRGDNGYRYYKITHIQKLNTIRELREIGFSMAEIIDHLNSFQVSDTISLLNMQIDRIDKKTKHLIELKDRLLERSKNLNNNLKLYKKEGIEIKELPSRKILIFDDDINEYQDIDFSLKKLQQKHDNANLILGDCRLGAIASLSSIKNNQYGKFQAVFYIIKDEITDYDKLLPSGTYISTIHKGSYGEIGAKMVDLLIFAEKKGYQIIGNPIELYIIDEYDTGNESEFITEIQIPIRI